MDIMLMKTPGGSLAPVDAEAREMVDKLKLGQGIQASVRRARNVRFHRKGMALFRLAYDVWEPLTPLEYKGLPVAKDFERFRKDMTILAGFYKAVYNARGEVRLEAESIRFSSMSEERFEEVFNAVLNVVWSRVLKAAGYASVEDVEEVIEELLRFDS